MQRRKENKNQLVWMRQTAETVERGEDGEYLAIAATMNNEKG